jgi:cyclase
MRVIARLDVKNEFVIKGINFEGLRKVGDPMAMAADYYAAGIDEIIFIDSVASLYNRNNLFHIIRKASEQIFVPITIGGGLRSFDDVSLALDSGADKVALNTAAIANPRIIADIARRYGAQCVVASIQAKKTPGGWEAYVEAGREKTGVAVLEWAHRLCDLGAGELLVTSVDQEGTKRGFDVDLVAAINETVRVPVIAGGGYGNPTHLQSLLARTRPSAISVATVLHYKLQTVVSVKEAAAQAQAMLS